jgi:hypothetical protein
MIIPRFLTWPARPIEDPATVTVGTAACRAETLEAVPKGMTSDLFGFKARPLRINQRWTAVRSSGFVRF